MPRIVPITMRTHMIELLDHNRTLGLTGLGYTAEMRDDLV